VDKCKHLTTVDLTCGNCGKHEQSKCGLFTLTTVTHIAEKDDKHTFFLSCLERKILRTFLKILKKLVDFCEAETHSSGILYP
jgi:hypothetical protein